MDNIYNELLAKAEQEYSILIKQLPDEDIYRTIIFIETIRQLDCLSLGFNEKNVKINFQSLDIMKSGWHLAAFHLYKPLTSTGFPYKKSEEKIQNYAKSLLYRFGCIQLLKRTAEMVKSGILLASRDKQKYSFKMCDIAKYQFVDHMQFEYLKELETEIKSSKELHFQGWNIVEYTNIEHMFTKEGNYFSINDASFRNDLLIPDIDSFMLPLLKPWTELKAMISYGSTEEIDNHFLVKATDLVNEWINEAGIHPNILINDTRGIHLMGVTAIIVSLHLKHINYVRLASENYPQISVNESIAIWNPLDELINDITSFTGFSSDIVIKALDLITLKESDTVKLEKFTSRFMPLLINIGNGIVFRPVSGVLRNPFLSIFTLLENRNPNFKNDVSKPREEWLRTHLYAAFGGTRYQTIRGNVNLRKNGINITDIDAAVFDNLTGELALFQIKWQDFFYNDVKTLRSKASNLTRDIDEWADKVLHWINTYNKKELAKCLRLKGRGGIDISDVYLFGLSKNAAQMQGFGFKFKSEDIAMCNWPQFQRNRAEIGPADKVISKLYTVIKEQAKENIIKTIAMPVTFECSDVSLHFEDLWNVIE